MAEHRSRLADALALAELGWRVFPVHCVREDTSCSCGNADCDSVGKHPRTKNGYLDATTDAARIRSFWEQWPQANVGLATGPSGLLVLDVDRRNGGNESLEELEHEHGKLPETRLALTGGGGCHYYFRNPGGIRSRNGIAAGIDVKADGGYVVAPGSNHASGGAYEWEAMSSPDVVALADPPKWLADLVRANESKPSAVTEGTRIPEGRRHDTLLSRAGTMRRRGFDCQSIEAALLVANRNQCDPPLSEAEVRKIAASTGEWVPVPLNEAPASSGKPLEPKTATPFVGLDLDTIARDGIPPMPWILPGWLAEGDVALLAGAGGVGKSTTAGALALALAAGQEWCGLKPTRPYRVLIFDQEQGTAETARLYIRLGANANEVRENLRIVSDQGLNLRDGESTARLEATIREFRPDIVLFDSVQQCFGLSDENDAAEVGALYRELFRLRADYGVTILAVHHKKKSPTGGAAVEKIELVRGSSAFVTQSSVVILATAGPHENTLDLCQVKRRGAAKQTLRIAYTEEPDGSIRLSCAGAVVDAEQTRAANFVVDFLSGRGDVRKKHLDAAAKASGYAPRTIDRALLGLIPSVVLKPSRGVYRIASDLSYRDVADPALELSEGTNT